MKKLSVCHPDRNHLALGLCSPCYHRARNQLPGRIAQNKDCARRRSVRPGEREKKTLRRQEWVLTRRYGLSRARFNDMVAQGCAICGTFDFGATGPCLDHDHWCCPGDIGCSECFRGVVCGHCNRMLGQARDSVDTLIKATEYLRAWGDNIATRRPPSA